MGAAPAATSAEPSPVPPPAAAADRIFARFAAAGSPGCSVVVVSAGQPILRKGYGLANLDDGIPNNPQTVFHVASLSKQFTAWAVLELQDEGKLELDAPVGRYVKKLPEAVGRVTLRQLMGHTSGVRDQWQLLILAGWRLYEDVVRDADVMDLVRRQRTLDFEPGTEFRYSNTGYTLLGQVVQSVSGMSLREFTTRRLFQPLGMNRTFFRDDHREVVPGQARAYVKDDAGRWRESTPDFDTVGATSLVTSVDDMARWAAHLDASVSLEHRMEQGGAPASTARHYGAGWSVSETGGETWVEHAGSDAGFRAHFLRLPDRRWTAVTLCNTDADAETANRQLAESLLGLPPAKPAGEVPKLANPPDWAKYEGVFASVADGRVRRIVIAGGKLREDVDTVQYALHIDDDGRFRNQNLGTNVTIRMEGGRPAELIEETRDGARAVYRAASGWKPKNLSPFEGRYRSDEIDNVFEFRVENGTLVLRARKDIREELEPTIENGFGSGLGHFQFAFDSAGRATGVMLSGERVRGVSFVKQ
jgi:CubicO group peptidase (beta-lactamase class C family)